MLVQLLSQHIPSRNRRVLVHRTDKSPQEIPLIPPLALGHLLHPFCLLLHSKANHRRPFCRAHAGDYGVLDPHAVYPGYLTHDGHVLKPVPDAGHDAVDVLSALEEAEALGEGDFSDYIELAAGGWTVNKRWVGKTSE